MRSLDVAPLCLDLLGMGMRYGVGQTRARQPNPSLS
jgi:hypothetical protein